MIAVIANEAMERTQLGDVRPSQAKHENTAQLVFNIRLVAVSAEMTQVKEEILQALAGSLTTTRDLVALVDLNS